MENRKPGIRKIGKDSVFLVGAIFAALSLTHAGDLAYRKQQVSTQYFSEGADAGDFNKDGKPDIVSGPYWYEGPDFTVKHEYNTPKILDPAGGEYTTNFFEWAEDVDKDGWTDIVIIGLPGTQAYWYKNPGAADVNKPAVAWKQSLAIAEVGNESPMLADINNDGKRELVFNTNDGYLGWAEPDAADPTALWTFHRISPKGNQYRFTHGLGLGDINGDGRLDLLEMGGWWEQPASLAGDPVWTRHAQNFALPAGGAQMFAYDIDGDGDNDVVSGQDAHGWGLAWFEQVRTAGEIKFLKHMIMGTRAEEAVYGAAFSQGHALALVDIDGDGLKDLVTGKRKWAHGPTGDVEPGAPCVLYAFQLQRTLDSVKFVPHPLDSNSGIGTELQIRDVDGNGLGDILVGNKNGTFVFFKTGQSMAIRPRLMERGAFSPLLDGIRYDIRGATLTWGKAFSKKSVGQMNFTLARP